MPDAKKPAKKLGPFTWVGWAGIAGAGFAVFYLYSRYRAGQAAAAQAALSGGSTIPAGQGTTTSATAPLNTWAAWEQAALGMMVGPKYSPTQALNDLQNWIQGGCVSTTGYNAIGAAIAQLGVPPGLGTSLPVLHACPTNQQQPSPGGGSGPAPTPTATGGPPGAPPALPQALAAAMNQNHESIVGTAWDSAIHDWLYLTNQGGVYVLTQTGAPTGPGFAGPISYLGLPASATEVAPGSPQRTFAQVIVDAAGGYTLVSTDGATYHFGP